MLYITSCLAPRPALGKFSLPNTSFTASNFLLTSHSFLPDLDSVHRLAFANIHKIQTRIRGTNQSQPKP